MMEFKQSVAHTRVGGHGFLLLIQNGHVFSSPKRYVGPEPKGSGSMHPLEVLARSAELAGNVKPVKKVVPKKQEEKLGLSVSRIVKAPAKKKKKRL